MQHLRFGFALLVFAVFLSGGGRSAAAQTLDSAAAQGAMLSRIQEETTRYALSLGLDDSYIIYCSVRMHFDTRHETDGWIPYGVNYNTIRSQRELDQVIATREAFETSYLRLCLADARVTLDAAQRRSVSQR